MGILPKFSSSNSYDRLMRIRQRLIHQEAKMGGELFGDVPKGHQREFFCLDKDSFVWHEAWTENGKRYSITTRYDVRPEGVFKTQNGSSYQGLSISEAINLYRAVGLYQDKVLTSYAQS